MLQAANQRPSAASRVACPEAALADPLATRRCKSPAAHREFLAGGVLDRDRLVPSSRSASLQKIGGLVDEIGANRPFEGAAAAPRRGAQVPRDQLLSAPAASARAPIA